MNFFTSLLRPIWNFRGTWKFNARVIRNHPRAGNHARESKFVVKPCQNHSKLRKWENREKQPKTAGFINFAPSNMHFRSADAANHLKCAPGLRAPPRLMICYVSRKGGIILYSKQNIESFKVFQMFHFQISWVSTFQVSLWNRVNESKMTSHDRIELHTYCVCKLTWEFYLWGIRDVH